MQDLHLHTYICMDTAGVIWRKLKICQISMRCFTTSTLMFFLLMFCWVWDFSLSVSYKLISTELRNSNIDLSGKFTDINVCN